MGHKNSPSQLSFVKHRTLLSSSDPRVTEIPTPFSVPHVAPALDRVACEQTVVGLVPQAAADTGSADLGAGRAVQALGQARIFSSTSVSELEMLGLVEEICSCPLMKKCGWSFPHAKNLQVSLFSDKEFSIFSKHLGDSLLPIILENAHDSHGGQRLTN